MMPDGLNALVARLRKGAAPLDDPNLNDEAADQLERLAMMTWQPIETAPQDDTIVDLWCGLYLERLCNYRRRVGLGRNNVFYEPAGSDGGRSCVRTATHWMLPPEAPSDPAAEKRAQAAAFGVIDCQTCGACCAYSDTWPELLDDSDGDGIPVEMIECETGRMKCNGDRCCALEGVVGASVRCAVYAQRPRVCREFSPEHRRDDCDIARAWSGLPPLTPNARLSGPQQAEET